MATNRQPEDDGFQFARELLWRTGLIGVAFFVMPPFAIAPTFEQVVAAYIAVVIWCYYDGAVARGRWPFAVLEAGVWTFLATRWTQLFLLSFGA